MADLLKILLMMLITATQTLASSDITYYGTDPECIPITEYNDNILEGVRTHSDDIKDIVMNSAKSTSAIVLERIQALADEIRPKIDITAKKTDVETLMNILVRLTNQSSGTLGDILPSASIMNNYTQLIDDKINSIVKQQQDEFKRMEAFMLSVTNSLSQITTSISTLSANNQITEGTVLPTTQPPTTYIPTKQTPTTLVSDPSTTATPSGTVLPTTQPPTTYIPTAQTPTTLVSDPSTTATPSERTVLPTTQPPTTYIPTAQTPTTLVSDPSTTATPSGCPTDFFRLGEQCFRYFSSRRPYDVAKDSCATVGALLAKPYDPVALRAYIVTSYGDIYWSWVGARGVGGSVAWDRDGVTIPASLPTWGSGAPGGNTRTSECLVLLTTASWMKAYPNSPYFMGTCTDARPFICEFIRE